MSIPCVDWENPSYKGGWLKIGQTRRGGINQNTPNPLSSSQVTPSFGRHLWIGLGDCPNVNLFTTVVLATRSGCRQGVVMGEVAFSRWTKTNLKGEHRTKTLRGPIKDRLDETRGNIKTRILHLVMPWRRLSSDGSRWFKPWWFY